MHFDLDADQLALRDAARALLDDLASPSRVRAVVDGPDGERVDAALWAAMVEQGWPGVATAETSGGLGLGWVEACVLLEEVGAHVAPAPILGTLVALDALAAAGRDVVSLLDGTGWAACCVAAGHPDAEVAAATPKAWCSEAGPRVCESALQVHGGIGFTWECDVHLHLKRAQFDAGAFGDATSHLDRLADLLRGRVEAGRSVL